VKFLNATVPWPYPADGVIRYYKHIALPAIDRQEEWHWTLQLKESMAEQIGAIGLRRGEKDNRGYWLWIAMAGQGIYDRSSFCGQRLLV
jgi:ribosomal-protein-alanine N-acetyltransferase